MLVSFWSPIKGHGHVTSSLIASASMMSVDYITKVLMVDTNGSEDLMMAYSPAFEAGLNSSQEGMTSVKRLHDSGKLDGSAVSRCASSILMGRLDLLATSDVDQADRDKVLSKAVSAAKTKYSVVYADLGGGELNKASSEVLELSDLVIVCLPQNPLRVSKLMPEIKKVVGDRKKHFVVGRFEEGSSQTVSKIATITRSKAKEISIVPKSIGFMDSLGKESVFDFFTRAVKSKKSLFKMNEEELCVHKVRELNKVLLSKLDLLLDKEDKE